MATDKFTKLKELTLKHPEKGILSFIANGAIAMWAPVVLVAPPAAETLPRVATTTTLNDPAIVGVAVGGSADVAGTGNAAAAAGDVVDVAVIGTGAMTKCVVDGAVTAIVVGDLLVTKASAGVAVEKAVLPAIYSVSDNERYTFAKALQGSTVNGDTILIIMMGGGP